MAQGIAFEADDAEPDPGDPRFVVDVAGFEGPLDLLLDLARRQKVDLHEISILALAEQYLAFVEAARTIRLELAADYLVMAAWLAFLKSRLLLPEPPRPDGPSAGDLAAALALRLRRFEAIREAARHLGDRARLGREVFGRGAPERLAGTVRPLYEGTLHDLLVAYAGQRQIRMSPRVVVARRAVWSLAEAREALERLVGLAGEWTDLDRFLLDYVATPALRASVTASALSAALELVREGRVSLRQDGPFAPLLMRRREAAPRAVPA